HLAGSFRLMDPDLEAKLIAEHPYILLWFLRGAILMQREGPRIPARVRADLQIQEDNIEQHLRSCCLQDWDEGRLYSSGDYVNVPDPDEPETATGLMYVCSGDEIKGAHPLQHPEIWLYQGRKGI